MAQLEPVGSGPTSYQFIPIFRPRLAEGPNIQLQKTFFDYLASVRISERAKLSDFDRIEIQKNERLTPSLENYSRYVFGSNLWFDFFSI